MWPWQSLHSLNPFKLILLLFYIINVFIYILLLLVATIMLIVVLFMFLFLHEMLAFISHGGVICIYLLRRAVNIS